MGRSADGGRIPDYQIEGSSFMCAHNQLDRLARRALAGLVALLYVAIALVSATARSQPAGAGGLDVLWGPAVGCYAIRSYGVGLRGDGAGNILIPQGVGTITAAFLQWVGSDDLTPQNPLPPGHADSTLTVNGREVVGIQPSNGYGPKAKAFGFDAGWFLWYADLGPTGLGIVTSADPMTLDVSGWDWPDSVYHDGRNGASVTVVYDTGTCDQERSATVYSGIDVYWHGLPEQGYGATSFHTQLFGLPFEASLKSRVVTVNLVHAGSDSTVATCRGTAVWLRAGAGALPAAAQSDLVERHDYQGRGYGVNGGVEVINDPFPTKGCTTRVNPAPDEPYEAGHPYPLGASVPVEAGGSPYRLVGFEKTGCSCPKGQEPEWNEVRLSVLVPPGTEWILLQQESEADQNGESGAWGGSFLISDPIDYPERPPTGPTTTTTTTTPTTTTVPPTTTTAPPTTTSLPAPPPTTPANGLVRIGDYVWQDRNLNGLQDDGTPDQVGVAGVAVQLFDASGAAVPGRRTTTDRRGYYEFADLPPGQYSVAFDPASLPVGYLFTLPNVAGDDQADSDANPDTGRTAPTPVLTAGQSDLSLDAGVVRGVRGVSFSVTCVAVPEAPVPVVVKGRVEPGTVVEIRVDGTGSNDNGSNGTGSSGNVVERFTAGPEAFLRRLSVPAMPVRISLTFPETPDLGMQGPVLLETRQCIAPAMLPLTGPSRATIPLGLLAVELVFLGVLTLWTARRLLNSVN